MPYYSLKLPSVDKEIFTKQFSVRDCLDINYLISTNDIIGIDFFVEEKIKTYSNCTADLTVFDKFLYLFSQSIFCDKDTININDGVDEDGTKIVKIINLIEAYNCFDTGTIQSKKRIKSGEIDIIFGLTSNFNDKEVVKVYSVGGEKIDYNIIPDLPISLYKEITEFYHIENDKIDRDTFKKILRYKINLSSEVFIEILKFLFNENIKNHFDITFQLQKNYNFDIQYIESLTPKELSLYVLTVNNYVEEENKKARERKNNL